MKLASKVSIFALLLLLTIGPMTSMAAEESSDKTDVTTVTEHNLMCIDLNATSYDTGYLQTSFDLDEVNDSMTLDFDAEVVNVTQNGAAASFSDIDITWNFFQMGSNSESTANNNSIEAHGLNLEDGMDEVTIFWNLELEATNGVNMESFCVDGVFTLSIEHTEEEHHDLVNEDTTPLLTLALTILLTLGIPSLVIFVFNKIF